MTDAELNYIETNLAGCEDATLRRLVVPALAAEVRRARAELAAIRDALRVERNGEDSADLPTEVRALRALADTSHDQDKEIANLRAMLLETRPLNVTIQSNPAFVDLQHQWDKILHDMYERGLRDGRALGRQPPETE